MKSILLTGCLLFSGLIFPGTSGLLAQTEQHQSFYHSVSVYPATIINGTADQPGITTRDETFGESDHPVHTPRIPAMSGTYTVGTGGDYPTLSAAIAAYNSSVLSGPVVFNLINTSYTGESFPIIIDANPGASSVNTLTIRPTLAATTISGSSSTALLVLNGSDYVIVDGSVSGGANTVCPLSAASRDLTFQNINTSTSSAVIWLQHNGSDGATHNLLTNLVISGSGAANTLFGIGCGGAAIDYNSFGSGNDYNSYINNKIIRVQCGLFSQGASTSVKNTGTVFSLNQLDAAAPDNIGFRGILVGFEDNVTVSGNSISGLVSNTSESVLAIGLGLGTGPNFPLTYTVWEGRQVTNSVVVNNKIGTVVNNAARSAVGIAVSGCTSGTTLIANNMISGVGGTGNATYFSAGIFLGSISPGTPAAVFNVYHNSVSMSAALTGSPDLTAAIAIAGNDPYVSLRNNIFVVTAGNTIPVNRAMAFYSATFNNLTSDNNNLYVSGTGAALTSRGSFTGAALTSITLADWQALSSKDLASRNVFPAFTSPADLHLTPGAGVNANLANTGAAVAVTNDIDCESRPGGPASDIGADEFSFAPITPCSTPAAPAATAVTSTTITLSLPLTGSYIVEYGAPGFVPGTTGTAGGGTVSGPANTSIQLTGLSASTNYEIRVRQQCAGPVWSENSSPLQVNTLAANDDCATAISFPAIPATGTWVTVSNQTTAGATQSRPPCGIGSANDVWYSFVASAPVMKILVAEHAGFSTTITYELLSGTCSNLTSVSCNNLDIPVTYTGLTTGTTYYLRVYSNGPVPFTEFDISLQGVSCVTPVSLTATGILSTSAILDWTEGSNAISWDIEIRPSPYVFTGVPTVTGVTKPYTITGLTAQTGYQFKVRPSGCTANWSAAGSFTTTATPPVNDEAWGALLLSMGACIDGFGYTNRNAIQSPGEPFPSCRGTVGYSTVWFKFVAPASGAVKVSNDYFSGSGSNIQSNDTRIALFRTTNVNDYSAFTMIACGDDGGINVAGRTIMYATGLNPGETYYIQEDGTQPNHIRGQFCISVEDLASGGMITSLTSCAAARPVTANSNFTEWLSVTDNSGRLVAMVRNPGGSGSGTNTYTTNVNINAGPVRSASGTYYLDRNFQISNSAVANAEVRLFFLNSELSALTSANSQATAANLGVIRQLSATCFGNFSSANGAFQFLPQTGNGVSPDGTLRWISFSTPGFSNFYISSSAGYALPVSIISFAGQREGSVNRLRWTTASESNSRGFDVQRSADGINYESIGFVNSLAPGGNSSDQLSYGFADNNVGGRKWYYRLRLVDLDGRNSLSNVVLIKGEKPVTMSIEGIYPNPANTKVNVMVAAPVRDKLTLVVTDMTGKNVMQQIISAEAGSNTISLDISKLSGGTYLIKLLCDNCESAFSKFVKQ